MVRLGVMILAALLASAIALGSADAQAPASGASAKDRAAAAATANRKMPACRKAANRQDLTLAARRAFMRRCLRG